MPVTDDYWEHEFYKESFSKDEIAYCVLQENPRMHFAARWCAKEALVKCDPAFKGQSFATMEVVRNRVWRSIARPSCERNFEKAAARGQHFAHRNDGGGRGREEAKVKIARHGAKNYWIRGWMKFAGRGRFGRLATRLATWFAPPLYKRNRLADLNRKGYVAPSAEIDHSNLTLGAHSYIGERVKIIEGPEGGDIKIGDEVRLHWDHYGAHGPRRHDIDRPALFRAAGVPIRGLRRFHSNRIRCAYRLELRLLSLQSRLCSGHADSGPAPNKSRRHCSGR